MGRRGRNSQRDKWAHKTQQPVHYLWANRHDNAAQIINRIKYNYEICSLFAHQLQWQGEGHVAQAGRVSGVEVNSLSMQRTELIRDCN